MPLLVPLVFAALAVVGVSLVTHNVRVSRGNDRAHTRLALLADTAEVPPGGWLSRKGWNGSEPFGKHIAHQCGCEYKGKAPQRPGACAVCSQ